MNNSESSETLNTSKLLSHSVTARSTKAVQADFAQNSLKLHFTGCIHIIRNERMAYCSEKYDFKTYR